MSSFLTIVDDELAQNISQISDKNIQKLQKLTSEHYELASKVTEGLDKTNNNLKSVKKYFIS